MADTFSRNEYTLGELRRAELKPTAMEQFAVWYQQAEAARVHLPNAMSLATVSAEGQPSLRTVLLKRYDDDGFVFFTNLQSRKAHDIASNVRVALMFAWLALERQVNVEGVARRISTVESLR